MLKFQRHLRYCYAINGEYRMNRSEFIEILRSQLSGQMQEGKAAAHVRYYEDYIQSQVRGGRTEEEVLAELGDPRLIAKTLIDTNVEDGTESYEEYQSYGSDYFQEEQNPQVKKRRLDLSTWYGKAIVIVCAAAIVIALIAIIGTVLPFFIAFALIMYLLSWFKKRH